MAKKSKKQKIVQPVVSMTKSEFVKAIDEASRLKNLKADYSSMASGFTKSFCKNKGLDSTAFGWTLKLDGMDPLKAQSIIRQFLLFCELRGLMAQADMFDDVKAKAASMETPVPQEEDPSKVGGIGVEGLAAGLKQLPQKDGSDAIDDIAGSVH